MQFPSRDFTQQFISLSYQDVVQRYATTGSNVYLLDGLGYVIFSIPTSSIGEIVLTQDQTASYSTTASYALNISPTDTASYSLFSEISNLSVSSSYASFSELSDTSSISLFSEFAATASLSLLAISASHSDNSNLAISASWASASISSSDTISASYAQSLSGISSFVVTPTLDSLNDLLLDNTNIGSVDWNNRWLNDISGNESVDWNYRLFSDVDGNITLDWQNKLLIDAGPNIHITSLDWEKRWLIAADMRMPNNYLPVTVMDWESQSLYDFPNNRTSIDWNNRLLYDNNVTTSIDWNNRVLLGGSWSGSISNSNNSISSSYALNSSTASYITASNIIGIVNSSSYSNTSSYATTSSYSLSSSFSTTSSWSSVSISSSYAVSASWVSSSIEVDPLSWHITGDQYNLSGIKSGSFNLDTVGTLKVGTSIIDGDFTVVGSQPSDFITFNGNLLPRQYKVIDSGEVSLNGIFTFGSDVPNEWSYGSADRRLYIDYFMGWRIENTGISYEIHTPAASADTIPQNGPDDPTLLWYDSSEVLLNPQPTITNPNTIPKTLFSVTQGGNISCSVITASLNGTSSWASNAVSASYAPTSTTITSSWATNAITASYITASNVSGYVANSFTASFVTASNVSGYVTNAFTASYITASNIVGNITALSASWASASISSSYSITASWSPVPISASWASASLIAMSASYASASMTTISASWASSSISASYSLSSSYSNTSSYSVSSSYATTSSYSVNANTASYITSSNIIGNITALSSSWASASISASYSITASFALSAGGSSGGTTLITASTYQITSSWSNNALTTSFINYTYNTLVTSSNWITASFSDSKDIVNITIGALYNFTCSNLPTGNNVSETSIFINNTSTTTSSLSFPSNWKFLGSVPTSISSSRSALLSLIAYGTSSIVAGFAVQY